MNLPRVVALLCSALAAAFAPTAVSAQLAPGAPSAAASAAAAPSPSRPRVGLVLSGGGARGGAHLGVLKVLEEMQVPVDVIVGTSAGAIVAAAYASGLPLAEIEREMSTMRTSMLFHDVDRAETSMRQKSDDSINYIGPEVGVKRDGVTLSKGAVAGIAIEAVLRRLTKRQRTEDFDQLPIPFRAVATDLASAEMVVLYHGNLAVAVRASMAIPAGLDPVELDGRLLVDGGLTRNLPVDVARRMGADLIIAIDIGTPLLTRKEITSVLSVSDQITRILTNTNVARSISELGPHDLLITPELGNVATLDFDLLVEAAQAGEKAARSAGVQLARYSLREADYASWHAARLREPAALPTHVDAVRVTGTKRVNPEVVAAAIRSEAGAPLDTAVIDEDIKRIYARGHFERVNYALATDPAVGRVLVADVAEKSWGPNYLRVGLSLATDFGGDNFYTLIATYRATLLNRLGAEWRTDLQTGQSSRIVTEFYQPLTPAQRLFAAAHAGYAYDPFEAYDDAGVHLASYRRVNSSFGFDLGLPLGNAGEARVGLSRGRVSLSTDTSFIPGELLVPPTEMGGVTVRVRFDTLDNLNFPRAGYNADLQFYDSRQVLGAADSYKKVSGTLGAAFALGPQHSLQLGFRGAGPVGGGTLPTYELFSLGGFLQLSGYKNGQLVGNELAFGRLIYNYRVTAPGLLDGAYLGVSMEVGRIGDGVTGAGSAATRYGNALYFAFDTPVGPMYIAYGRGDHNNQSAYFFLGRP
jgi:NTE family protein